jgi:hypothetical protein
MRKITALLVYLLGASFVLFGSKFILQGVFGFYQGHERAQFDFVFGSLLFLPGYWLIRLRYLGEKQYDLEVKAQLLNPREPWKNKSDWFTGTIRSTAVKQALPELIFALLWLTIPLLVIFSGNSSDIERPPLWAYAVFMILPIIGIFLTYEALKTLICKIFYGKSELIIEGGRGVIGGELKGELKLQHPIVAESAELKLYLTVLSGNGRGGFSKRILWSDRKQITRQILNQGLIHLSFSIPRGLPESDLNSRSHYWTLSLSVPIFSSDYPLEFVIPVFS